MTLTTVSKKGQTPLENKKSLAKVKKEFALDIKYHDIYKVEKDPDWLRERIVKYAIKHSQRKAAKHFKCSINTVRLWFSRKNEDKSTRYNNRSKAPKTNKNKTSPENEQMVLNCWEKEHMGGHNLKYQYNLPVAGITAYRILKRNGKTNTRKRKHKKTKDLHNIKAKYKCFEVLQLDGKKLNDMPNFYPYHIKYGLPLWQITATCEKSGASFISYCQGETSLAACTFVVYLLEHLKRFGIKVRKIKTDKGSFAVARRSQKLTNFQKLLEDTYKIKHQANEHKNQNSDVERFHGLIEQYFYDICQVVSKTDFYRQAIEKQLWFNFIRLNSGKGWKKPLDILKIDYPKVDPQVLALRPIDLDMHTDIYCFKVNPNHKPLCFDDFFIDVPEESIWSIKNNLDNRVYQDVVKLDGK